MDGLYLSKSHDKYSHGLLFKYKNGGWWVDVAEALRRIIQSTSDCWSWENRDHGDHMLVLPWKPLLEWQS